jgi:hypothetical protein
MSRQINIPDKAINDFEALKEWLFDIGSKNRAELFSIYGDLKTYCNSNPPLGTTRKLPEGYKPSSPTFNEGIFSYFKGLGSTTYDAEQKRYEEEKNASAASVPPASAPAPASAASVTSVTSVTSLAPAVGSEASLTDDPTDEGGDEVVLPGGDEVVLRGGDEVVTSDDHELHEGRTYRVLDDDPETQVQPAASSSPPEKPASVATKETGSANNAFSDEVFFDIAKALCRTWNQKKTKSFELEVAGDQAVTIVRSGNTVTMSFSANITKATLPNQQPQKPETTKITLSRTVGDDGKVERRIDCATTLSTEEQFTLLAQAAFLEHKKAGKQLRIGVELTNRSGTPQADRLTVDERKLVKAYIEAGFEEVYCQGVKTSNSRVIAAQESIIPVTPVATHSSSSAGVASSDGGKTSPLGKREEEPSTSQVPPGSEPQPPKPGNA